MKSFFLVLALFVSFDRAEANYCQDELVNLFTKHPATAKSGIDKAKVEEVLDRTLDDKKIRAIEQSLDAGKKEIYTASDIVNQNKFLKKAGLSVSDVSKLREAKLLPSTAVHIEKELPSKIETINLQSRRIGVEETQKMKNGQKFNYVVGDDGQHYLVEKLPTLAEDTVFIAKNSGKGDVAGVIREAGSVGYNPTSKKFEFNTNYGSAASEKDLSELASKIAKDTGQKIDIRSTNSVKRSESKTYECLDILSAQNSGKNFIVNRIVPDNAVAIGGIAVGEALGAGRTNSAAGREVIAADLIGTNINLVVGGFVGSKLVLNNASLLGSIGTRAAVSMGMIEIQKNVYESTLTTNSSERANNIATFDQYHFAGRLGWNHMFEKFLVGNTASKFNLPNMIFKACQNNSRMKVLVNPQTVRFVEKGASAAIYYGLRKSIIDE